MSADTSHDDSMVTQRPTSHDSRDGRVTDIQRRIGRGEYRVDTQVVADAILRRLLGGEGLRPDGPSRQDPCS